MSDLIRRDEALAGILNHYEVNNKIQNKEMDYCFDMLNSLRAVDAVEVVKCKYCKHFTEGMAIGICRRDPQNPILPMEWDNFCKHSERREENESI